MTLEQEFSNTIDEEFWFTVFIEMIKDMKIKHIKQKPRKRKGLKC